jgi:hypothetical protein
MFKISLYYDVGVGLWWCVRREKEIAFGAKGEGLRITYIINYYLSGEILNPALGDDFASCRDRLPRDCPQPRLLRTSSLDSSRI